MDQYIEELDKEWAELMMEAKNLGFKKEEIQAFLNSKEINIEN